MKAVLAIVAVLALGTVFAEDYEESFTIFLDLDDFHVTQAGNHEFLHEGAIGEHDNVLLQLSEDEMRHFMNKHDTHDCEQPEELHEVVSFIQEAMYGEPSAPDYIDDAIASNYIQNNAWGKAQGFNQMNPLNQANPFNQGGLLSALLPNAAAAPKMNWGFPLTAPQAQPVQKTQAQPTQKVQAQPQEETSSSATTTEVAKDPQVEEDDAVRRFREAYRAYKLFNHAVDGLTDVVPEVKGQKPASLFESLMDDDDRRLFGMFSNHNSNTDQAKAPSLSAFAMGTPSSGSNLDDAISKIVDEAYNDAMKKEGLMTPTGEFNPAGMFQNALAGDNAAGGGAGAVPPPPFEVTVDDQPASEQHHHHHHHHRRENEDVVEEKVEEKVADAKVEENPKPVEENPKLVEENPKPVQEKETAKPNSLSGDEKKALHDLVASIASKKEDVKSVVQEALADQGLTSPELADEVVSELNKQSKADDGQTPQAAPQQQQQQSSGGASRPSAPLTTSHIGKAPKPSEFVPENVYDKQSVPFAESLTQPTKHVAKRILIPRMEEPGPVIGGGSHPLHIHIPPADEAFGNTRPVAPVQSSITISESKTPPTKNENTVLASTTASTTSSTTIGLSKSEPSIKAATVAVANDEALTAPEVVIF